MHGEVRDVFKGSNPPSSANQINFSHLLCTKKKKNSSKDRFLLWSKRDIQPRSLLPGEEISGILACMKAEQEKYQVLLKRAQSGREPVVLINACTHGHETVGIGVIDALKDLALKKGTLLFNVANEKACHQETAFIESDLNRSFPGNLTGTYEEQLAYYIHPLVKACAIVIDIHATETANPGNESALIVTKLDTETKKITDTLNSPRVLVMDHTKSNAFISGARVGIGFEYGKNNHPETLHLIVRDIKKLLVHLGMTSGKIKDHTSPIRTRHYRIFNVLSKEEGVDIDPSIQNYTPILRNHPIGTKDGRPFLAPCNFIPILFGNNRYKDIFGFMGREI